MTVWIVTEEYNTDVATHGEANLVIVGVFATEEHARAVVAERTAESADLVATEGCDDWSVDIRATAYEVASQ